MQVVKAGSQNLLILELEQELITQIVASAGFDCEVSESARAVTLALTARDRHSPLLLFDAADPSNVGWFKRCQFYVDGVTGRVLQTPLTVANRTEQGKLDPQSMRVQISKELPANFKLPGRQPVSERVVYGVVNDFLHALLHIGVGLCGHQVVKPLTGRKPQLG